MNVVRCTGAEKHFFDGDIYPVCPYCSSPAGVASDTVVSEVKETSETETIKETKKQKKSTKSKKKIFPKRDKKEKKNQRSVPEQTDDIAPFQIPGKATPEDGGSRSKDWRTFSLWGKQKGKPAAEEDDDVTLDLWQTVPVSDTDQVKDSKPDSDQSVNSVKSDNPSIEKDNKTAASVSEQRVSSTEDQKASSADDKKVSSDPISYFSAPEVSQSRSESDEDSSGSLLEKVKNASASSEGKTMSYFSAITYKANEAAKPQTLSAHIDPVVGWLVGIQGEHFGESFTLGAGKNSIGRNDSNRIVLDRDPAVSRDKHALIIYEPKHRRFYFKLGDSSGLAYVNDEYITETKQLSARDTIELGNSKFVFVPLCDEDFTWEDYLKG